MRCRKARRPGNTAKFAALCLLAGCNRAPEPSQAAPSAPPPAPSASAHAGPVKLELQRKAMGTSVHLVAFSAPGADRAAGERALERAFEEMVRLEKLLSEWRPDSEVSAINRSAGRPVTVGSDVYSVIEKSVWAGTMSGGTFDITFQSMSELWKFGDAAEDPPQVPAPAEVALQRRLVDYRKLVIDPGERTVSVPRGMQIGLGGIAKGYIVDRAATVLREAGLRDFLVQAGGDLYGAGKKPDGSRWVSGIQDPRGAHGRYFALIELEDHAFSTAGDYARSYIVDGKRYHHIIDPRTGYPATASRSVTVWAPDAFTADAVDDAIFILGPEKGLQLAEMLGEVGVVIVDAQNRVTVSERIKGKVKILHPPSEGI